MGYNLSTLVRGDFADVLESTRRALADQGFGVLTEIDMAATLKKKLDVDVPPQVILGACNPPSAYEALQAEESIGLLLPCNVVVRSTGDGTVAVEAINPDTMHELTANDGLKPVAERVKTMLQAALDQLPG